MLFDNNDIDLDFSLLNIAGLTNNNKSNINMPKMNLNKEKFLPAKEAFLRGNTFKDEYLPYKNLTYIDIKPKNDREAKLFTVMQYSFAINDMNLYLDTHPYDTKALKYFEELVQEEKKAKKEYVESFGPLKVTQVKGDKFDWVNSPWSWESLGGNIYV